MSESEILRTRLADALAEVERLSRAVGSWTDRWNNAAEEASRVQRERDELRRNLVDAVEARDAALAEVERERILTLHAVDQCNALKSLERDRLRALCNEEMDSHDDALEVLRQRAEAAEGRLAAEERGREELAALLAEAQQREARVKEQIYLALADEDTDWEEWAGEVLPCIHDSLLGLDGGEEK